MLNPVRPLRDPKTALQEWAQARGLPPPSYRQSGRVGPDHAPVFIMEVSVNGYETAIAQGSFEARRRTGRRAEIPVRASASGTKANERRRRKLRVAASCALIGAPNAGKSTLLNALVGAKVSIVSRKVQTTRALVRGIALEGAAQIIFVDTPGIFAPKRRLDRAMVDLCLGRGAATPMSVALLIDARKGVDEDAEAILARLPQLRAPKILVLNKIDTDRA